MIFFINKFFISVDGQKYKQLELVDINNNPVKDLQFNEKPFVVSYWATWCKPCIQEFDLFVSVNREFDNSVKFVMISDDSPRKAKKIIENRYPGLAFYFSKTSLTASVRPVTTFYYRDKIMNSQYTGAMEKGEIVDKIKEIINK